MSELPEIDQEYFKKLIHDYIAENLKVEIVSKTEYYCREKTYKIALMLGDETIHESWYE